MVRRAGLDALAWVAQNLGRRPYFRGRDRLVMFLLGQVSRGGPRRVSVAGLTFALDLSDGVSQMLFLTETLPEPSRLMARLATPGATVVDVGANLGYTTMVAARAVGSGGRVLAFEPGSASLGALTRNLSLNGIENVEVIHAACGEHRQQTLLHVAPGSGVYASLRPMPGLSRHVEDCEVVRLDEELQRRDIARPELVKIDVEGAEWAVLKGMGALLSKPLPSLIVETSVENMARFGYSPMDLLRWVIDRGYRLEVLVDGRLVPFSERLVTGDTIRDVLAVDPLRHPAVVEATGDMRAPAGAP